MNNTALLQLENIRKEFDGETILSSLSLSVNEGEFVTLLGPSGCGKTTTLRLIGGFETPDSGSIFFEGKCINDLAPNLRHINTVFQKYALFPNRNVFENVAFGLELRGVSRSEIRTRVGEMLELVNLKGFEKRSVTSLSGGQQQRVAIARALIVKPRLLLLDEPLGALDLKLRKEMQVELKKLHDSLGMTFIYVTHDQEEALTMSDKIIVMNQGEILQQGTPIDIYNEPTNAFVADFIGESNIFPGIMERDCLVDFFGIPYDCVDTGFRKNEPVDVVIRPEDIILRKQRSGSIQNPDHMLPCRVRTCLFKGIYYEMMVETENTEGYEFMAKSTVPAEVGSELFIDIEPENIHIMKKSGIDTVSDIQYRIEHDPTAISEEEPDEIE